MSDVPELLVVGDPRHGVTRCARDLADEVARHEPTGGGAGAHVHFTDRLFGRTATAAADRFEELAATTPLTVTLHDLPQASDGTSYDVRAAGYARVARAARGVVCNSEHERALLADLGVDGEVAVIPLPVPAPAPVLERPAPTREVAVLGFFYPGKGHEQVARALATLPEPRPALLVLGRASDGHEGELAALLERAGAAGVPTEVTGYLDDADLLARSRRVAVPVVAHEHVSASGSLNSWLAAGRRPLVRESRYAREMSALRPGTLTLYPPDGLAPAIETALAEPDAGWLAPGTDLRPHLADVAAAYRRWWREEVRW